MRTTANSTTTKNRAGSTPALQRPAPAGPAQSTIRRPDSYRTKKGYAKNSIASRTNTTTSSTTTNEPNSVIADAEAAMPFPTALLAPSAIY